MMVRIIKSYTYIPRGTYGKRRVGKAYFILFLYNNTMKKTNTTTSNLLLYITIATLSILSSFNENIHVQARIYEENSKRRLFTRRAAAFLGSTAFFKYQSTYAQKCDGMVSFYNCQHKNVGKIVNLNSNKAYFTLQKCSAACLAEARKTPSESGCCFFRQNQNDGYPCKYTLKAGTKSATHWTRHSGICHKAPDTCQQTGCGTNQQCVASGDTYVCRCNSGYFNYPYCTACSSCSGNTYVSSQCTDSANTQCSNCVKPSDATYSSNTGCAWTCNTGYYESQTSCYQCTSACTGHSYESKACTSTQNRECTSCTRPDDASWNSVNGCDWTCHAGYYQSGSSCLACTSPCTGNTYETSDCTSAQNRVCTSCTKPSNSIFSQTTGCSWTCNSGYYKSGSNCLACTICGAGQYETKSCTPTQNRECTAGCPSQPSNSEHSGQFDGGCKVWQCKVGYYKDGNTCVQCVSTCKDYGTTRAVTIQDCNIEGENRICQACIKPSLASWSTTNGCTYECNSGAYLDTNAAITVTRLHSNSLQRYSAVSMTGDGKNILLGHGLNGGTLKNYDENGVLSDYYNSVETWKVVRTNHDGSSTFTVSENSNGNTYVRRLKHGIQQYSHIFTASGALSVQLGISINGQHVYISSNEKIYYSPNALESFSQIVAATAVGNILDLCVSSDGKIAWTLTSQVAQEISPTGKRNNSKIITDNNFVAIACSADVKTIVIVTNTNIIYTSSDSGVSFVETKDLHNDKINSISVSGANPFQSSFNNSQCVDGVCDGWDCGAITTCGLDVNDGFGSICGGYGTKGKNSHIKRVISPLTIGTSYTFSTDVIIGDSWDGEYLRIFVGGNNVPWYLCHEQRYNLIWNFWDDKPNHKTGRNVCKYNTILSHPDDIIIIVIPIGYFSELTKFHYYI
jgi:hypothetical protein